MNKSNKTLTAVLVLQALTLAGQWLDGPRVAPALAAPPSEGREISDAGGQRQQIIEQLKQSNQKLDRLINVLESGKLQVKAER